jgi:predicted dehydrogenase
MRFLIAGLGSVGRRHLRNLIALGEKDIVLLRSGRATLPDLELEGWRVAAMLDHALDKYKPDAVIIANPTALHLDVAIPAAEAGCHILLEKPIAESLERISPLEKALHQQGGRLLVGFQFRFHPALNQAREIIRSGELGHILSVHAHWGEYLPDWHPWEDYRGGYAARSDLGGGVLRTLTHPFDYLRYLVGEIAGLWCFSAHISPLDLDVEDAAEVGLRFVNGAVGGLHLNYFQRPPAHWLEIAGESGTLRWNTADNELQLLRPSTEFGEISHATSAATTDSFFPPAGFERNDLFLAEMRHFLDVVRGEVSPLCTLADGVRALELALAAEKSASKGMVVEWTPPASAVGSLL